MATVLVYMNQHLLWDLMSEHSGTLTPRSVHPASPELLTNYGPLTTSIRGDDFTLSKSLVLPI